MESDSDASYDIERSYDENYSEGPFFKGNIPFFSNPAEKVKLFDFEVNSPLGIPAGLLLNSHWVSLYATLGFDILTYKTVRSSYKGAHALPNCIFVKDNTLIMDNMPDHLIVENKAENKKYAGATITNSFGMPSKAPDEWQEDVERSKGLLADGQVLIVSVVGSGDSEIELVEDFKRTAAMAKDAGADIVELNLSCPNVNTSAGELYKSPELTAKITSGVKKVISAKPLFIKTGVYDNIEVLRSVLKVNARFLEGIVGVNSVKMKVVDSQGLPALGKGRVESGICGSGIKEFGVTFLNQVLKIVEEEKYDLLCISTGGVVKPSDFDTYLSLGATAVMSCTGALFNPLLAIEWKNS